jgi:hypothetical protein
MATGRKDGNLARKRERFGECRELDQVKYMYYWFV